MRHVSQLFRIALLVVLVVLTGCAAGQVEDDLVDHESEPEDLGVVTEPLSSLSCNMSTATGYKSGSAFKIEVVTVDGKKVEWKTANAYMKMAKSAAAAGVQIRVVSGFRTMDEQKYLYGCYTSCSCNSCNLAAKPGYSNHQSGHALDLNTSSAGVYSWMSKHAGSYGFKRTVPSELWHWEWWGTDNGTGPCNDLDKDDDGVNDTKDNCPAVKNAAQTDSDKDGKGDACDTDDDGDGVADTKDNCPTVKNANQTDTDKDGKGDTCDSDDDGDGLADTKDNCPTVKNANQADTDKDGKGDACELDDDADGFPDATDVCPTLADAAQTDTDKDGKGDACDDDDDGDGIADAIDVCPLISDPSQADSDHDGEGDACDPDTDTDGDGVADSEDDCPGIADADQTDTDADGEGDACDDDDDGDGVPDTTDVCPGADDHDKLACGGASETEAPPEGQGAPPAAGDTEAVDGGCSVGTPRGAGEAHHLALLLIGALALSRRRLGLGSRALKPRR